MIQERARNQELIKIDKLKENISSLTRKSSLQDLLREIRRSGINARNVSLKKCFSDPVSPNWKPFSEMHLSKFVPVVQHQHPHRILS